MFMRPVELDRKTVNVVVGQRVHSILYGGRDGIVYAIHGEQAPQSIGTLGGFISYGGSAYFDIVFEHGGISQKLPESIMRGVQWRIYDEIATAEEIAEALVFAEEERIRKEAEAKAASERRAREREQHKANYPHLLKRADKPDWSNGRLAAANIRTELKKLFPGAKFKVTSSHNSVDVHWTDGPAHDLVKKLVDKYQSGSFDGMEDIYRDNPEATFSDVFGGPQYTFCYRNATIEGVRKAWVAKEEGNKPSDVPDDILQVHPEGLNYWIMDAFKKASV